MLSKYVWLISVEKISFLRTCCGSNKSDKLHNKGPHTRGNIKWCSFALRFCASTLNAHDNLYFPLWRAYLLLLSSTLCKSHGDLHLSFFILSFGKLSMLERTWYIYISNWMWGSVNYYCWHYPWGKRLWGKNYKPLSFSVSD